MLTEIEIVKEVLVYLDGWETDDNNTDTINESAYMSTEELSMTFYNDVYDEYTTTQRLPEITNVEKLLCKITAGRLWNKYNILVNTNTDMEESTPDRYGSKLIQEAEKKLKFYSPQLVVGLNSI